MEQISEKQQGRGAPQGNKNSAKSYNRLVVSFKSEYLEEIHNVLDQPEHPASDKDIQEDIQYVVKNHYARRGHVVTYQPYITDILSLAEKVAHIRQDGYGRHTDKYDAPILLKYSREVEAFTQARLNHVNRVDLLIRFAILVYYLVQLYGQDYDEAALNATLFHYSHQVGIAPEMALYACIGIMQCRVDHPGLKDSHPEEAYRLELEVASAILNEARESR